MINPRLQTILTSAQKRLTKIDMMMARLKADDREPTPDEAVQMNHDAEFLTKLMRSVYQSCYWFDPNQSIKDHNVRKYFDVKVEKKEHGVIKLTIPAIIPKKGKDTYFIDSLNIAMRPFFPEHAHIKKARVEIIYHYNGAYQKYLDYDNTETRSLLNCLTKYVLEDDSPKHIELYQRACFDGSNKTEVIISPMPRSQPCDVP